MVNLSCKGKHSQGSPIKFQVRIWPWIGVTVILALILVSVLVIPNNSAYRSIVRYGYTGTQEQWLASLVGEETGADTVETAYELAVKNGYGGTESEWIETLTGVSAVPVQKTPYQIVSENGFSGSLSDWLTELADKPEKLGRSKGTEPKTEYEFACEYGYSGTFIEWIVSVTYDHIFE